MKLKVIRKSSQTDWLGAKSETVSFITFNLIGDKNVGCEVQLIVTDEEYANYSIGQTIEVNNKT